MPHSPCLTAIPPEVITLADYERLAPRFIPAELFASIAGGAAGEHTLAANRRAFDRLQLLPRVLRDFSAASTRVQLLGATHEHPILLAPVAYQALVHPEGELASAAGAEAADAGLVSSTLSSFSLEQIAGASRGSKWFQLYLQHRREHSLGLVQRAEQAGYTALVVTVDVPVTGLRYRAQRAGYQQPALQLAANLVDLPPPPQRELAAGDNIVLNGAMADAPTWDDLHWLLGNTRLPILVKGILHPEDAATVAEMGLAGIVVSNHGGRSLDHLPATIDALPMLRNAVGKALPILLDSGIRSGADVFKALALGADAVLVGRPQVYALAVAGALGVAHMLTLLRNELALTMALAGCPTIADISHRAIFHPPSPPLAPSSC